MANSGRLTHHGPVLAALTRGTTTLEVFTEPALALLLARWPHAEASRGSDPCEDLERNYEVLTGVAGRPISRPGPGAALLRCLGLTEFAKRFSHLTSRRRLAAHPDSCLLQQLRSKLESLDPAVREEGVFKFLAKGPAGSAGWAAPPTGSPGTSTSARNRAKAALASPVVKDARPGEGDVSGGGIAADAAAAEAASAAAACLVPSVAPQQVEWADLAAGDSDEDAAAATVYVPALVTAAAKRSGAGYVAVAGCSTSAAAKWPHPRRRQQRSAAASLGFESVVEVGIDEEEEERLMQEAGKHIPLLVGKPCQASSL